MTTLRLRYGRTAEILHWTIVGLLGRVSDRLVDAVHRGQTPGAPMTFHVSIGIVILALIVVRFVWR